ncbi:MAG: Imm17 family immunity protein [Muribaculaceae bacterium]|nr:Imm17 family immunity protein [Muribaculaceae bacterium]
MTGLTVASYILGGIFAGAGALCLYVSIAGCQWFFRSAGVRALTSHMKRSYARILYALIGVAILGMAARIIADAP